MYVCHSLTAVLIIHVSNAFILIFMNFVAVSEAHLGSLVIVQVIV